MESAKAQRPQYCDIVMKVEYQRRRLLAGRRRAGGKARLRLLRRGGALAGAIAAAAVAAAEAGRRTGKNEKAYEGIAALPGWLGSELTSLFQPSPRMRPLFRALLAVSAAVGRRG